MKITRTNEDIHNFAKELILFEKPPLSSFGVGICPIADIGISISYYKYLALIKQIRFAATSLTNSYKTSQIDLWGNVSEYPIWERTMYLQDAFSYYNSCLDYIYNILYFYYDIEYKNSTIEKQDDVIKISQKIQGQVLGKIDDYLYKNQTEFFKIFDDYKYYRKPINQKTIDIKHRAGFWTCSDGLNTWGKASKTINNTVINLTDIVTPMIIDIDHEINELKLFHNRTVELQIEMCRLMDYPNQIRTKLKKYIEIK